MEAHGKGLTKKAPALVLLALMIAAGCALLWNALRWKELPPTTTWRRWQRGHLVHIDKNGDGIVDMEMDQGVQDNYLVREDTDFDGYFDKKYVIGLAGMPMNVVVIHEKAPRH